MKLASINQGRDGQLIVVNSQMQLYTSATDIAPTLQAALDNWDDCKEPLETLYNQLENSQIVGETFDPELCASPLPRAFQWADGSAYVNHVELVRKARNAEIPASFWTDPLMYQGGSDSFLGPREDIAMADEDWGIDFEAEVAVIVDDVPMGISADQAKQHIQLVMLVNDVSLRNLIPGEFPNPILGLFPIRFLQLFHIFVVHFNDFLVYSHQKCWSVFHVVPGMWQIQFLVYVP